MQWLLSADTGFQLCRAVTAARKCCSVSSCAAGSRRFADLAAAQGTALACCLPAAVLVIGTTAGKPEAHSAPVHHQNLCQKMNPKVSSSATGNVKIYVLPGGCSTRLQPIVAPL